LPVTHELYSLRYRDHLTAPLAARAMSRLHFPVIDAG
jgi:hypothetical protein